MFSLDNLDDVDTPSPVTSKETQSTGSPDTGTKLTKNDIMANGNHTCTQSNLPSIGLGKQTLKVFDGDDAAKRNQFRLVSIPRIIKNEEVVVRCFFPNQVSPELQCIHFTMNIYIKRVL